MDPLRPWSKAPRGKRQRPSFVESHLGFSVTQLIPGAPVLGPTSTLLTECFEYVTQAGALVFPSRKRISVTGDCPQGSVK